MILCQKTDSISLYYILLMYLSSIGISVGRETPGDCSREFLLKCILYIIHVQCIYTVFLVPHVRVTKLHCYCNHSVLCIG